MNIQAKPCQTGAFAITLWIFALAFLSVLPAGALEGSAASARPDSGKYHWNLGHIYKDQTAWKNDLEVLKGCKGGMDKYKGTLAASASRLLEALALRDRINLLGHRLQSWAEKRVQEDGRDPARQALVEQLAQVTRGLDAEQAFIEAEILAMAPRLVQGYLASDPRLQAYRPYVEDLLRVGPHRLHPEAEAVLAQAQGVLRSAQEIYLAIRKDVSYAPVPDASGKNVPLKESFRILANSPDERVRRDAHLSRLNGYEAHLKGLGAVLAAEMKRDVFLAGVRRINTSLDMALFEEAVPAGVFKNYLAAVKAHAGSFQRWLGIRRRLLGLETLQKSDLLVDLPIPGMPEKTYEYDEAVKLVEEALAPNGEAYLDLLRAAQSQGWVDVFPAPGKDNWAGSASAVYGVHPYVMLNWDKSLFNLQTLAHELGHAINQHHMAQDEPFLYQRWWFCSSEVASTCNEILLKEHMLAEARDKSVRLSLLADEIERMAHLFFGLGLLSEYELQVHTQAEQGGDLSPAWLRKTYGELARTYYGASVAMGPLDDIQGILDLLDNPWGTCYVRYVYALGYSASRDFARRLRAWEPGIQTTYRRFLGRGRAHYPIDALKEAGVDFTTSEPFERTLLDFAAKVDQFERLLKEVH